MKRDISTLFIALYIAALVLMAGTLAALWGLAPGVEGFSVEGLSRAQASGLTLAVMALVALRLFLHIRNRRSRSTT